MATIITDECVNCGACEPACPNTAIYEGGKPYELDGKMHEALSASLYYIVPEKCTECVGHFNKEQCAAICPADCCIPDPDRPESEEQLFERAQRLHPDREFEPLSETTSRFRRRKRGR
jgi:ferredoxin